MYEAETTNFNITGSAPDLLGYQNPNGCINVTWASKKFFRTYYKITYQKFRDLLNDAIIDPQWDSELKDQVFELIKDYVPVRSGKLLDTIIKTLHFERNVYFGTHHYTTSSYQWDRDYPLTILGAAHTPPKTGYADLYKPSRIIPNVHLIHPTRDNMAGLFLLNDPGAVPYPQPYIMKAVRLVLENHYADIFNNILIQEMK